MSVKDIIPLKFTRDDKDQIICPVSMKELTEKIKVAAIKTTQNVFSYEVLVNLNRKPNFWRDLVTSKVMVIIY
jgi:peptidyl-prolyl cis-trans isomerase-like protein 2